MAPAAEEEVMPAALAAPVDHLAAEELEQQELPVHPVTALLIQGLAAAALTLSLQVVLEAQVL